MKTKDVNKILLFILIFNVIGNANALQAENRDISRELVNDFCKDGMNIIYKKTNYCEKIIELQDIKESKYFDRKYNYFQASGSGDYASSWGTTVLFSDDGKVVSSDTYFYTDSKEFYYSLIVVDDIIFFYRWDIIVDYSALEGIDLEEEGGFDRSDLPRIHKINVLLMDKKGNYKIFSYQHSDLQEVKYEEIKEEFDFLIKFLSEELPIKVEY